MVEEKVQVLVVELQETLATLVPVPVLDQVPPLVRLDLLVQDQARVLVQVAMQEMVVATAVEAMVSSVVVLSQDLVPNMKSPPRQGNIL
jgi:hypothetical protein